MSFRRVSKMSNRKNTIKYKNVLLNIKSVYIGNSQGSVSISILIVR